jgi:hypothetical protein
MGSLFLFDIKDKSEGPAVAGRVAIDKAFFASDKGDAERKSASQGRPAFSAFSSGEEASEKDKSSVESEFVIDFRVLKTDTQGSFSGNGGLGGSGAKKPEEDESAFDLGSGAGGSTGFGF